MTQLTVLTNAIEKLETAEAALGDARCAFDAGSIENEQIAAQFEVVGDAVYIIKNILARIEQVKFLAAQLEPIVNAELTDEEINT